MSASVKKVVAVLAGLQSHLPQDELNDFDDSVAQKIMDDLHTSGREFMRFLQNGARVQIVGEHLVDCDVEPSIPSGWSLKGKGTEHRKGGKVKLERRGEDLYANGKKIKFFLSESQKVRGYIQGHDLRKELVGKPVLNANILDYLLEHQELIPAESWKDKCVFFWADIYRGSYGNLYVRCLCWGGGRWDWSYGWLDDDFVSDGPAAVSASQ